MSQVTLDTNQPTGLLPKRWTINEYHQIIASGIITPETPVELINGQIYRESSPATAPRSYNR